MSREVTPRDAYFFELVKEYRALKSGPKREHLFARMHNLQHKALAHYAYKFRSPAVPMTKEDAMQATLIGFLRAIEKWDPQRGAWIGTLFLWCRKEVQCAQGLEPVVYRPSGCAKPYQIHRKEQAFYAKFGREPTAEELGVKPAELERWREHEVFVRESYDTATTSPRGDSHGNDLCHIPHMGDLMLGPLGSRSLSAFSPDPPRNAEQLLEDAEYAAEIAALTPAEIAILLGADSYDKEDLVARFE